MGAWRRSRRLRLPKLTPIARACAVSRPGISFPPLTLGSPTPNLSPRSRRRRSVRPARGAPAHVPTHAPAYGGGQGSRAGGRPARAEQPGESALLSLPPPHSPPRSLPPLPKNVPLRGEWLRPEVTPPSPARPFFLRRPPRGSCSAEEGAGRGWLGTPPRPWGSDGTRRGPRGWGGRDWREPAAGCGGEGPLSAVT